MLGRRSRSASRTWLAALVVLAVLGRALIPAGFMPSASSGFALMLCPGHGMAMPEAGTLGHGKPGNQHHEASICPFAAAAILGAAPSFADAPFVGLAEYLQEPFAFATRATDLAGPPRTQSPRAPPTFNS
jgi:hypothetical protein